MRKIDRNEFIKHFTINLRWGQLLERERSKVGVSREMLAVVFDVAPVEIGRWETGFGSPMASLFYQVIVFLGSEAYQSASELWYKMQAEQYFVHKEMAHRLRLQKQRRVAYLALGAIKDRHKNLAA